MDPRHHAPGAAAIAAALELVPDPTFAVDQEFRIVAANRACARLVGDVIDAWIGEVPLALVHPDDLPIVLSSFEEVTHKEVGSPIEVRVSTNDGFRLVEIVGAPHPTDDGHIVVVAMRDLTERRRWELAAGRTDLFRSVVEHAAVLLALVDRDGRVTSASGTFNRQLGHDISRVVGSNLADWVNECERGQFRTNLARAVAAPRTTVFEATLDHAEGHVIPYQFSVANLLDDPVVDGLIVSASDISARRALEARLTQLATTDPLTGLANRAALITHLAQRLVIPTGREQLAVFFIDLDRFKPVNDLHGHDAGDAVLAALAQRLLRVARAGDLVARLGGDEFVLVCEDLDDPRTPTSIAHRIEETVAEPIGIGGITAQVFASVGFAVGTAAPTAEGLLAEADAAMYRVKQRRRGALVVTTLPVAQRRELVEELVEAIDDDPGAAGFRMYFQPVVRLPERRIVGSEALVRWEHPRLGLLSPSDFLPIAEDAGLDLRLGTWIVNESIAACARFGDPTIGVAVNLSAAQLADPNFVDIAFAALDAHGLTPDRLCVEVTETTMLERAARGSLLPAVSTLERVKQGGVSVAIDDFGTGYSSLAHVRDLPADILKIDRSFVAGVVTDRASRGIVAAVIALAHAVDMHVIAEGVETPEQHAELVALGADAAQGYWYGRPVAEATFAALLTTPLLTTPLLRAS